MLPRCWRNHQEVGCNNTYLAGPLGSNMRPSLCNACTRYCSQQRSSAGRSLQSLLRESLPKEATKLRGGPTVYSKTTRVLGMPANPHTCEHHMPERFRQESLMDAVVTICSRCKCSTTGARTLSGFPAESPTTGQPMTHEAATAGTLSTGTLDGRSCKHFCPCKYSTTGHNQLR